MRLVSLLVLLWLVVGAIAAGQRGYYSTAATNCATLGTIAVTIVAGPLNYLGINPKVENCELPEPSE